MRNLRHHRGGLLAAVITTLALGIGVGQATPQAASAATPKVGSTAWLRAQNYGGRYQAIAVNHNKASFTAAEMKNSGTWVRYGNLDRYNRVTRSVGMLNVRLMPKAKRQPLTVNPTGWHNKKIGSGYLYNRCHVIGYQLTGQNNNWKNLFTGTQSLNTPNMLKYENIVAKYLRGGRNRLVRYSVEPIFRGKDQVARGVHMMARSVNSNAVNFNVYIFNVQKGVTINYANGTSVVSKAAMAAPAKKAPARKVTVKKAVVKKAVANNRTVYIVPSGKVYHLNRNCRALRRSRTVWKVTLKQAQQKGHVNQCKLER